LFSFTKKKTNHGLLSILNFKAISRLELKTNVDGIERFKPFAFFYRKKNK